MASEDPPSGHPDDGPPKHLPTRGPVSLLRDSTFGPYFVGKLLSTGGVWVQNLAGAVLMFELTRSAFMVGLVSVAQFIPTLGLALWAGTLVDRFDRRKVLLAGRVISGVVIGTLAGLVLVLGTDGFGGEPVLLGGVFLAGIGWSISQPAGQAIIPALVPPADLEPALAVNAAAPSLARTLGPALGAGILLVGGPAVALLAAALAHLTFAAVLLFLRPRPYRRPQTRPSIWGGLAYLNQDRKAAALIIGVAMLAVGADPAITLTPSLADEMGGGDEIVGLFASAFGAGAVLFTLSFRALRRFLDLRVIGVSGFVVLSAGLVALAFSPNVGFGLAGFLVAGFGFMMATVALNTRIQRRVPEQLRGRVMALWGLAFLGSRPFAAMLNGSLADAVSIQAAVLATATLTLVASVLARVRYSDPATPAT